MLEIVWIVVERTVLLPSVELVGVLHHLFVESVEHVMGYHVVDNDETIMIEASYGNFQILRSQLSVLDFAL